MPRPLSGVGSFVMSVVLNVAVSTRRPSCRDTEPETFRLSVRVRSSGDWVERTTTESLRNEPSTSGPSFGPVEKRPPPQVMDSRID